MSAALVIAGLLAIALLVSSQPEGQESPWTPASVDLGSVPVVAISCEWAGDVEPYRRNVDLIGVLEATVRLDTMAIFDDPLVDFDPSHVWMQVDVHDGPRTQSLEQRISPRGLADGPTQQVVTVRFEAIYDEDGPASPPCDAEVAVS